CRRGTERRGVGGPRGPPPAPGPGALVAAAGGPARHGAIRQPPRGRGAALLPAAEPPPVDLRPAAGGGDAKDRRDGGAEYPAILMAAGPLGRIPGKPGALPADHRVLPGGAGSGRKWARMMEALLARLRREKARVLAH